MITSPLSIIEYDSLMITSPLSMIEYDRRLGLRTIWSMTTLRRVTTQREEG